MSVASLAGALRSRFTVVALFTLLAAVAAPTFAAKWYIDKSIGDLKPEEVVTVPNPQPAQFLFEFQTDGVANGKATKFAKPLVIKSIDNRHVFSQLSDQPVESKALLTITFNNITEKGAASKGFKTGLTFGLAPLQVVDRYQIHFEYTPAPGATPLVCDGEHALFLTMGKKDDPTIGTQVKNAMTGINLLIDQAISHGINCLAGKMVAAK